VVEMPLPEVNIGDAYETCMNETVAISNQGDTSSLNNYRWNISRINAPQMIYQPYASGEETVILQVTSPFGCMASDSAVIESIALPYPYLGPDKVVCFDSTTTLQAEVETSLVETSLLWSNGTMGVQSSVSNDGSYVLTANHRGCIQKDSIMVEFVSIPEINMGALLGDSIFCFESLENEVLIQPYETRPEARYSYRWADGIYGFSREVEEEGIYIIEVSEKGCAKSGSIQIIDYCEPRLAIPNAFSPNDDGLNDVFMPYSEFVTTFEMYIFNRWGEQIFSTTDPNEGWNGRHQNTGQKSQVDVYVYKIVYDTFDVAGNIERIEKVGHVTLLK
jgi:gliding motility-associated-like protein